MLRIEGIAWSAQRIPTAVSFGFLDLRRERLLVEIIFHKMVSDCFSLTIFKQRDIRETYRILKDNYHASHVTAMKSKKPENSDVLNYVYLYLQFI
jgi:hypothetical protein